MKYKPIWEQFLDALPYEKLMGSSPVHLLEMFYYWLEDKGIVHEVDHQGRSGQI